MNENVLAKLKILAESAKYDVSCSSSGTVRSNKPGMLGNTVGGWGICHSFAEDGRCRVCFTKKFVEFVVCGEGCAFPALCLYLPLFLPTFTRHSC